MAVEVGTEAAAGMVADIANPPTGSSCLDFFAKTADQPVLVPADEFMLPNT